MENASKALIMAAGMLIGMLILSLAVYLFVSFGKTSAEVYKKNEENQLNKFNTQFTSYVGTELTIYDVITITNLATENNRFYDLPKMHDATGKDNYITVVFKGKQMEMENWGGKSAQEWIDIDNSMMGKDDANGDKITDLPKYTCTVEISTTTQRVFRVSIN